MRVSDCQSDFRPVKFLPLHDRLHSLLPSGLCATAINFCSVRKNITPTEMAGIARQYPGRSMAYGQETVTTEKLLDNQMSARKLRPDFGRASTRKRDNARLRWRFPAVAAYIHLSFYLMASGRSPPGIRFRTLSLDMMSAFLAAKPCAVTRACHADQVQSAVRWHAGTCTLNGTQQPLLPGSIGNPNSVEEDSGHLNGSHEIKESKKSGHVTSMETTSV